MRIALVAPYDPAVPGGVQGQVLGLASALLASGQQVLVVGPGRPSSWPGTRSTGAEGVELAGTGPSLAVPANGSRAPICVSPLAGARTRAALARFRPEVIHVHEPFVPGPALAATRSGAAPVVGTFHRAGAGRAYRLAGLALGGALQSLTRVVAVSDAARETLEAVLGPLGARVEILANAVDLARGAAARVTPVPTSAPTAVFVGRHEPRKGLEPLLEAFARLEAEARLWVIGDGPLRRSLEARYSGPRVSFLGRLGDEALARHVAGADLLVAPSLGGESFGVVLLEAMAAGTAVLASDLPGYRLAAGAAAAYVPPGDIAALASALGVLLTDPAARATLVARGEARARDHGFEALAAAYLERYREALTAAPAR